MHPGYVIGAIYLHREPVDFRKQINGLAAIVEGELEMSPFSTMRPAVRVRWPLACSKASAGT